jgi:BMFP domain-containing protein YqiC
MDENMNMLNEKRIKEIKARLNGATPGEWKAFNYAEFEDESLPPEDSWWLEGPNFVTYDVYSLFNEADAKFIAHAPADIRALVARISALEAALWRIGAIGPNHPSMYASIQSIARRALAGLGTTERDVY